ncbi:O-antigen ligase family protein [Pseudidiomarina homiensis]|uniref:O-antigen ligase family protein n=1 Tax=Pseudidiomarina homiensis TaxID=364198 RepID=UPI00215AED3A|nr:O-antigen ligase family protein [Pseudidiomarina homiensis]
MNVILSKSQLGWLLSVALVFPIIWLDTMYGVLSYVGLDFLRISLLYRTLLLLIGFYLAYTLTGPIPWVIKSFMLFWSLMLLISTYPDGEILFTRDVNHMMRRIYPFCVLLICLSLLQKFGDKTELFLKGIAHFGLIFSIAMIFSLVTGIGNQSYGDYAFGVQSFYIGGNDVGLAALLSLCVLFANLYKKINFRNLISVGACILSVMLLGTKAGWAAGALITASFTFVIALFLRPKSKKQKFLKVGIIISVVSSISVASVYVTNNFDSFKFQFERASEILEGENPRARLVESANRHYDTYPQQIYLKGDGASFFEGVGREYYVIDNNKGSFDVYREIEQEWQDAVGHYGVPYATFLFSTHCFLILLTVILFFKWPTVDHFAFCLALFIYLGHGIMAGHAFVSGQPSHLVAVIYAITLYRLSILSKTDKNQLKSLVNGS